MQSARRVSDGRGHGRSGGRLARPFSMDWRERLPLTGAARSMVADRSPRSMFATVAADIGRNGCGARTVAALPDACRNWRTADRRRTSNRHGLPDRLAHGRTVARSPRRRTLAADCVANGARTACKTHGAFQTGADMGGAADGLQGRFRRDSGQTSRARVERLPRLQGERATVERTAGNIRRHWPESARRCRIATADVCRNWRRVRW